MECTKTEVHRVFVAVYSTSALKVILIFKMKMFRNN